MASRAALLWSSAGAGTIVLGLSTSLTAEGTTNARTFAVVAAACLGAGLGVLVGALQLLLAPLVRPLGALLGRRLRLGRLVDRDAPERAPVVALHAAVLGAAVGAVILGAGMRWWVTRLRKVQITELAETLTVVGALAFGVAAVALGSGTYVGARRLLARLDARWRLPLPPSSRLRRVLYLAVPLGAVAVLPLLLLERVLGPLGAPLWLVVFVAGQIFLVQLLPRGAGPRARLAVLAAALLGLAGLVGGDQVLRRWPRSSFALEAASPGGLALAALRAGTDVDRDGASSLFGGRDCAPFSSARGPDARDVPGNGVDEDCDGSDTAEGLALPEGPAFYGDLPKDRVLEYDIVWFVIDALRADHTGLMGYGKPTTPHLDELGAESLLFTRALSQSSATMLSFPSMLTGVDPGRLDWRIDENRLQVAAGQPYLTQRLKSMGYTTGFIASEYFSQRLPGLLEGWSHVAFQDVKQRKSSRSSAALASSFIVRARDAGAPFFLVVYLPAPHIPYVEHTEGYPKFGAGNLAKYDSEIANADRALGSVLDVLRSDPERWGRTVVIVTGDHGEEFGEHGGTEHARTCHKESLHVPLVLRLPGEPRARIDKPVGLLDIAPTLVELVDAPLVEGPPFDGHSLLLTARAPERLPPDRPLFCSVISQKAAQGDFFRRAVRSGKWAFMKELRGSQQTALYDVEADPGETTPVAPEGEAAEVARRLDAWLGLQLTSNVGVVPLTGE